jgi:hypothetical protein
LRFSQRLSVDHFVLELDEDERSFGDVADLAGTERDPLQGPPPLGHQREAAFALVTQGPQQRITGFGVRAQCPAAGRLLYRDVHPRTGAFVPGVGQQRQVLQVGPGLRQDVLAGGGQVMGAAWQYVGDPQRNAAGRG